MQKYNDFLATGLQSFFFILSLVRILLRIFAV